MSGEETWALQQRVLDALTPALAAEYDPGDPSLVGFVLCTVEMTEEVIAEALRKAALGSPKGPPVHWGWMPRDEMAEVLQRSEMGPMAADLQAGRGAFAGHVQCVVMLGGLSTVANLPIELLKRAAMASQAPRPVPVRPDKTARNKAKAQRRRAKGRA